MKDGTKTLTNGTDYTISYSNNENIGTATVTVTGKGNYSNKATKNFTITAPEVKPFNWGQDNWNFNNSSAEGYFKSSTYRQQINSDYLSTLRNNLTNSEYQAIFVGSWYESAWLDDLYETTGMNPYALQPTPIIVYLAKEPKHFDELIQIIGDNMLKSDVN